MRDLDLDHAPHITIRDSNPTLQKSITQTPAPCPLPVVAAGSEVSPTAAPGRSEVREAEKWDLHLGGGGQPAAVVGGGAVQVHLLHLPHLPAEGTLPARLRPGQSLYQCFLCFVLKLRCRTACWLL